MSKRNSRGWKPPADLPSIPNPRIDPFRDRAGALTRLDDGSAAGQVYIEVEQVSAQLGGGLWWRRWGPWRDSLLIYVEIGDEIDDISIGEPHIDDEIDEWRTGRFSHGDDEYAVEWLDDTETARVRTEFGFNPESG